MLDSRDSRLTMTTNHKISFSIVDILDPKKFNSKRERELCVVKESFHALNADGASLELDAGEEGQHQVEHNKTGRYAFLTSFLFHLQRVWLLSRLLCPILDTLLINVAYSVLWFHILRQILP